VPTYRIDQHAEDTVTVVDLFGEIDLSAIPDIQACLNALLQGGVRTVVIDLAEVTFLDSAGIGALISGRRACTAVDTAFHIRNAHGRVAEVLDLTGVTQFLAAPTEPATVAATTPGESDAKPPTGTAPH
jgi:anti-sigma B factor antagonist